MNAFDARGRMGRGDKQLQAELELLFEAKTLAASQASPPSPRDFYASPYRVTNLTAIDAYVNSRVVASVTVPIRPVSPAHASSGPSNVLDNDLLVFEAPCSPRRSGALPQYMLTVAAILSW
jgi:hypothetical protein